MKNLILALCGILLTACATQPVQPSSTKHVPPEQVFEVALTQPREGKGEIRFVRDTGFYASAVKARLSVDGRPFAELAAGEVLSIYLEPGIYHFSMLQRPNLFKYEVPRELEVEVKLTRRFTIRVGFSEEGPVFQPLTY